MPTDRESVNWESGPIVDTPPRPLSLNCGGVGTSVAVTVILIFG